jgi:hypothetical protein
VLDLARDLGRGTFGLATDRPDVTDRPQATDGGPDPAVVGLVALAVRPLVTGRPTVVLRGVPRDVAAGERVATWWPDALGRERT